MNVFLVEVKCGSPFRGDDRVVTDARCRKGGVLPVAVGDLFREVEREMCG